MFYRYIRSAARCAAAAFASAAPLAPAAAQAMDPTSPLPRDHRGESLGHSFRILPQPDGQGPGQGRVPDLMLARQLEADRDEARGCPQMEGPAGRAERFHGLPAERFAFPDRQRFGVAGPGLPGDPAAPLVRSRMRPDTSAIEPGHQFSLGLGDALLTLGEILGVGSADHSDQARIQRCDLREPPDLPGRAHAHLQHCGAQALRQGGQGFGHTQRVVAVPGSLPPAHGGGQQILGAGFPHASGDAAYELRPHCREARLPPALEGGQGIRHHKLWTVTVQWMVHQQGPGALLHRLQGEVMTIPLGSQGHEAGAGLDRAGIQRQRGRHHGAIPEDLSSHLRGSLEQGPEAHAISFAEARCKRSRTASQAWPSGGRSMTIRAKPASSNSWSSA